MQKILFLSAFVALFYFIMKLLEMKYSSDGMRPLKYTIRDSFYVFSSSVLCLFVYSNINGPMGNLMDVVTDNKSLNLNSTEVFTGEPEF